ncbi:MAG TPA: TlpA family protein disulfide reductase [Sulfurovum sp.]|jgi:thiol-disulfide isomerase/thioredoxin|nr:TlpA family protein disulfide reductase [Sulfurovum sp.]HQS71972.1 TlpA family protein disulfide reductase [Sulfurovum sp.]HQS77236.1 TlpA family protein disulfide reductase [Sulfurovum sp.]HQT28192.1 TlpA family protein disulfide reductase [Sulfurovum sp.]
MNYTQRDCVHKIAVLLLLVSLLGLVGCEDKPDEDTLTASENTTEILTKQRNQEHKSTQEPATFSLHNTHSQEYNLTVYDEDIEIKEHNAPIVLLHFFATWCQPCVAEMPYLNDLQKKYRKELFVAGILTHDSIQEAALQTIIAKNGVRYFVSNAAQNDALAARLTRTLGLPENFTIPLIVIYVEGRYFTHYEGNIPVEMIEYDIEQAKKQLKAR